MAFASTIIAQTVQGNKKVVYGTFTNGASDTGGDIETGLQVVESLELQHTGTAVVSDVPVVNETFPLTGRTKPTIVTVADKDGIWKAIGY